MSIIASYREDVTMRRLPLTITLAWILFATSGWTGLAEEAVPLHERIDELIEQGAGGPGATQAVDAEFLRRVYLDLAGRIPNAAEARAFLADTDSAKRPKLIDQLLTSQDHVERMRVWLDVMLMERLGEHKEWTQYLRASVESNKPWDQLVREMLNPDSEAEATRAAAFFFSKRLENYGQNPVDVPAMVRDVGRLFMGIDVQCAQCHDHLFVDDYKQEHYQGLFAFVAQVSLRSELPYPAIVEKPLEKKIEFVSVFVQEPKSTGPRLPQSEEIAIPTFAKGEEYEVPPDPKTKAPGKLKFSALKLLSEQLPTAGNELFARNIANRLWWMMMGRGLVEPLDLHHAGNRGSHPELLDLLSKELADHKFDMRWLLRELALTRTYQRSSHWPDLDPEALEAIPQHSYRLAVEKPLLAEQMLAATLQATGTTFPDEKLRSDYQKKFNAAFANPPRDPEIGHHPALRGALFLMNDELVRSWLDAKEGNLVDRLVKIDDPKVLADELYLSVLSRNASPEEQSAVEAYLTAQANKKAAAVGHLAWSLLASNEFCVNH